MFKLLWSALVGGGPGEWAALALGAAVALGGAFAGGALWQASRDVKAAVSAAPAAVAAQHDHDVAQHQADTDTDTKVKAADADRDAKFDRLLAALAAKPQPTPQNNCVMPPDVVELLNDAGH